MHTKRWYRLKLKKSLMLQETPVELSYVKNIENILLKFNLGEKIDQLSYADMN